MAKRTFPKGIVLLRFGQNECYTEVTHEIPEGFVFDRTTRTYESYRGVLMPFGEADIPPRGMSRAGLAIGLYNVLNIRQLQSLLDTVARIALEGAHGSIS